MLREGDQYIAFLPRERNQILLLSKATSLALQAGRPARWQPPAVRVGEAALWKTATLVSKWNWFCPASIKFLWRYSTEGYPLVAKRLRGGFMDWQALWDWLSNPSNQQMLVWIGGGAAAVAAGMAVFRFLRGRAGAKAAATTTVYYAPVSRAARRLRPLSQH